jgi:BASS family bile acid:Na+ symporter
MEASVITNVLLPLALGVIMFGLGLSLTLADFRRVAVYPRAVVVGLVMQMLVLTAAAFGLAVLFGLAPELAVGLMLLAASPGGATANIFSHLARGDVALNITLTALNSALSLITLPLIVTWSLDYFLGQGRYIPPPVQKVVEVAAIIVLPVILGMTARRLAPGFAARMERPIRIFAVVVLAALIAGALVQEWKTLGPALAAVGLACLAFNLVSMAVGYAVPLAIRLPRRQAIAIAMEIGIHNGTLAIFIALNVLQSAPMSLAPAIYSLLMFVTAAIFVFIVVRRHAPAAATE